MSCVHQRSPLLRAGPASPKNGPVVASLCRAAMVLFRVVSEGQAE